ncbi:membrane hypothetical protein [Azospirillaceae bacterium]
MRRLMIAALIAIFASVSAIAPSQAQVQPKAPAFPTPAPVPVVITKRIDPVYPVVIGLGAIAGVAFMNLASTGAVGVPFVRRVAARLAGSTTAAAASNATLSISRFYTVTSAVVGAWVGNWLYGR